MPHEKPMDGIVAVMLSPFDSSGAIDYASLSRLIGWYIDNGVDVRFAVCGRPEAGAIRMPGAVSSAAVGQRTRCLRPDRTLRAVQGRLLRSRSHRAQAEHRRRIAAGH